MGAVIILVPEEVYADVQSGGTLGNDKPARTQASGGFWSWSSSDILKFKIPTISTGYTGVAMENLGSGEDFDIFIYDDYQMTDLIGSSTLGADETDFVLVDGNTYGGGYKYVLVEKFTGQDWSNGVRIETDYHSVSNDLYGSDPDENGPLEVGSYRYSLFEYHGTGTYSSTLRGDYPMLNVYDIYLDAGGEYDFDIGSVPSGLTLSMDLYKGSGNFDDSLASDSSSTAGGSLSLSYQPEASGWYALAVMNEPTAYSNSDNYTVLISSDFEMSSSPENNLIAPGMDASYMIDVGSLGVTKDIDLHYRWRDATSNVSAPSGASASLSTYSVEPDGLNVQSVYLNVTTTSSLSSGTYYLEVYGNDTGVNGNTHSTGVTLTVTTDPDFFLSSSPEGRVISPDSETSYTITMDTINDFNGTVTLSASSSPSTSNMNFTFSPAQLTNSTLVSNLTISTNTNIAKGDYNITIQGSDGSTIRYANTTLSIQDAIQIDIISPLSSELVSGVHTFKVRAGTPSTTKSVKIGFGGNMATVGTLNMYYNSATGFWERAVNTFTYIDGPCSLNITAENHVGGLTTKGPVNFTLSNSAPNPIINSPLDRSYVTGSFLPVSVAATTQVISCRFRIDQNAWVPMTQSGTTWNGTWDTTLITDGEHTLTVEAKDSAGLTGDSSLTIFIDNNQPTCTLNSPIGGQYIEGSYTFRVVATDTVGVKKVDLSIFGDTVTLPYNPITSSYEYTVTTSTMTDGTYSVYATAYDNVNLSKQSDTIIFNIDNNQPSLSLIAPMDEEIIGGDYTISIMSSDTFLNKVEYMIDSSGWKNLSGAEPNWFALIDSTTLTDGDHTLSIRALDNASHETSQSIDFIVDNTAPTCNVISPFQDAFVESVYTFKISSTDIVGIDNVMVNVFGNQYQAAYNLQTGYYEYSFNTLTINDGTYSIWAQTTDLSGKVTNSSTLSFKVDNEAPQMTVNEIQNGDYVSGNFLLNVSVTDPFLKDVRYSLDGGEWIAINVSWDTTALIDGSHSLRIQARDQAGHSTTQTISLIVDNNVPVCAVNSPVSSEYVEGAFTFKLSATDSVGIDSVEINVFGNNFTATFSASSGYYEYTTDTSIRDDGIYSCYAIVYDNSGKMNTSGMITFQIDNNAPSLLLNSPQDGDYLEGVVNMNVSASDVFLSKVEYNVDGSGWVNISVPFNTSDFGDGQHSIQIRVVDLAGHVSSSTIRVILDNNVPTGSITAPASGQYIGGTSVFTAIASDIVGVEKVTIDVFNSTLEMTYNTGAGSYEYRTDTSLIADGTYAFSITILDTSGKSITIGPRTFYVDNNAPVLRVISPISGQYVEGEIEINVSATDVFLDRIEYDVDGSGWIDIDTILNTTLFSDGSHTINIRAVDGAGHITSSSVTLTIDNNLPGGSIGAPAVNQFIEGTFVFTALASDNVGIDKVTIDVFGSELQMTYNSGTGSYEYRTDTRLIPDGTYDFNITILDMSGKSIQIGPRSFNVDNNVPVLRVNSPLSGDYLEGDVDLMVNATDVFLDRVEYDVDGTGWIDIDTPLNTTLFSDGTHRINFRVIDEAGHTTSSFVDVIIDNTDPTATIGEPGTNQYIEDTFIFTALATDSVGIDKVIIEVFNSTLEMNYNTGTGNYEYRTDTRLIPDGNYTVFITVHDMSGKSIRVGPRMFFVDNNAPVMTVNYPSAMAYLEGIETLVVNATDVFLDKVEYNVDDTGWVSIDLALNTTLLSDGEHSIMFRSMDKAGHVSSAVVSVIVDNTYPYGAINSPVDSQFIDGIYLFQAVASDVVGIESVKIEIFNSTLDMNYNSGSGYYEFMTDTSILEDGNYTLWIFVTDLSGKETVVGPRNFQVDNHIPELEVYNIQDDLILSSTVLVNYTVFDTFLDRVEYEIDNTGWVPIDTPFNTTLISDGSHSIRIRAVDKSEKVKMLEFDILIDNLYPTCTINSPVEGEFVEGEIVIRVSAFDQVGVDYVLIKVYDLEARVPYNAQTGYYEYSSNTVTWGSGEDGIRNVTATAFDLTGKSFTYGPIEFNVDNRAPTININSPKEGEIISGMFFFDVDNGDVFKKGTDYNIDGASWQPVSIGFNTRLVEDGPHSVTIRATDLAGHVTIEMINIIVDNHDPEILIAGPNEGEFIENSYTFRVAATDEVGIERVIMNVAGKERTMTFNTQSGYYEYMIDTRTLIDGTYHINATVIDLSGKTTLAGDLMFRIDNNAPDLRVEAPVKDQLVSGLYVVRATTNDEFPGPIRYAIDGTTWFEVTTPWNTTRVNDGRHTITISTVDQAGHRTEFDIEVIVDNTEPIISQASITPGQTLAGVQTIRFYAYDSIGISTVQLSLNGAPPFEIFRGEGGLYYEYLFDTRIVSDGNQVLNLTAIDRAGNTYETSYGFKVDNTGPEISLDYYWIEGGLAVSIGEVKEGNSVVFEATVIDSSGVGSVMINIDSSGWREMTPDSNSSNPDTYVLFWPTAGVQGGSHVFQLRTSDKLGNENIQSGLINVKKVEEKKKFVDSFKDALPIIWLILFIILVILLLVLAYTGVLTKWAKGEGMQKEPKEEDDDDKEKGLIEDKEKAPRKSGGISGLKDKLKKDRSEEEKDWDHEGDKES